MFVTASRRRSCRIILDDFLRLIRFTIVIGGFDFGQVTLLQKNDAFLLYKFVRLTRHTISANRSCI
jgi:hypothetical protein